MTAAADGISLQDLAAVAGVCLTVTLAVISPYWARLRRLRQRLADLEESQNDVAERQALATGAVARGFEGTQSAIDFSNGLLQRLIESRQQHIDATVAFDHLHTMTQSVKRAQTELQLLDNSDAVAQLSAVQALASQLGDRDSLVFLEARARAGAIGAVELDGLIEAARLLRSRIEEDRPTPPETTS